MLQGSRGGLLACVVAGAACTYDPRPPRDGVAIVDASIFPNTDEGLGGQSGAGGGGNGVVGGQPPVGGGGSGGSGGSGGMAGEGGAAGEAGAGGAGGTVTSPPQTGSSCLGLDAAAPCDAGPPETDAGCDGGLGSNCRDSGLVCGLPGSGRSCVECLEGGDCADPSLPFCGEGTCVQCSEDEHCSAESPHCLRGQCVACRPGERRCEANGPDLCEEGGQWAAQPRCGGKRPHCDPDTGQCGCVEPVASDEECRTASCEAGVFVEGEAPRGTECSGGYCDGDGECLPCLTDEHCGASECGELSNCEFEGGLCDETGSQQQTCVDPVCDDGACRSTSHVNSQECGRSTAGERCADAACVTNQCEYEAGVCDETGSQTRQCTIFECSAGSCQSRSATETLDCDRDTEGNTCEGGTTCDGFEACQFANQCSETGEQSRTCRDRSCAGGSCHVTTRTETRSCTRDTDGNTCESGTTCGGFSSCEGFAGTCDETGTQSRSCTDRACSAGSCSSATRTETRSCTRETDGDSCGLTNCGAFGSCGGFASTCDETGTQSRSCTDRACSAGSCSSATRTETRSCIRDTDGDSCGLTTCGAFGSCGGFSNICDETGTQSRSCTDRACSAGSCGSAARTERRGCERDTDGDSCGVTTCGPFGSCGGFSNICDETGLQSRSCVNRACSAGSCSGSSRTERRSCTRDTDGRSCEDGVYCNGAETCTQGACRSPGDPCTQPGRGICVEGRRRCVECTNDSHCSRVRDICDDDTCCEPETPNDDSCL